jgi:hypothetical protein
VKARVHGLLAGFASPDDLLHAARKLRECGYRSLDAFTPFPIEDLPEAIGYGKTRMSLIVLIGGILGCFIGFGMQYYFMAVDYKINVGGRPYNSWPMFIPITFELTVLFASLAAFFGFLIVNGFPRYSHPVFSAPDFKRAYQDTFFLCLLSDDPLFDDLQVRKLLNELHPVSISELEEQT